MFSFLCQTVHEGRIYQLKLFCDKDYPEKPPSVRFHSRINMTCVNHETGVVSVTIFTCLYLLNIYAVHAVDGYMKLQTVLTQCLKLFGDNSETNVFRDVINICLGFEEGNNGIYINYSFTKKYRVASSPFPIRFAYYHNKKYWNLELKDC